MTPEKKLCQIKRRDRDSNLQSQEVQLLLEPIVDKKERFITRRLNHGHPVSQSVCEKRLILHLLRKTTGL